MRAPHFLTAPIVLTLALASSRAHADVQVGLVVTGEATMLPQVTAEVEGWMHNHAITVVPTAIDPESVNAMIDCFVIEDLACAQKIVDDKAQVPSMVFLRVDASPGANNTRDITLSGYWFDKGKPGHDQKRTCEKCSDQKARETADELVAALVQLGNHETGHLKVTSTPSGARVTLDGKVVGVTPLEDDVPAGDHTLELSLGARTMKRLVTIRRGDTSPIDVPLPLPAKPARVVPAVVMGAGLAAVVTGIVLIGVNEDPTRGHPQPKQLLDTTGLGIGVGIVGLAALGAGAYLWVRAGKATPTDVTPVVSITHDGAYLGWARSF